jgi:hypothetical protein
VGCLQSGIVGVYSVEDVRIDLISLVLRRRSIYFEKEGFEERTVSPLRARSKRRAARSRAAGGREDGSCCVGDWTAPLELLGGGDVVVVWAADAADWPYTSSKEGILACIWDVLSGGVCDN